MTSGDFGKKPKTSRGYVRVQVDPPEGSRLDSISVNWCDKTTWYPQSVQVVDETLIADSAYTVYTPATARAWVDVMHGKLSDERTLRSQYQPVIKVNGVAKIENSPEQTDNDYSIDYTTGAVTFNVALQPTDAVTATYYYVTTSLWIIKPIAGKVIRLLSCELQFSQNADMTDTVIFQPYGYVQVFAPTLWDGYDPPGPYPTNTLIPLGNPTVYQTMQDIINEACLSYPQVPQLGGPSWRGMKGPEHIFQWPWCERGATDLYSSMGMEIQINLEGNIEFGGDVAVATFYGISEDEA